MNSEDVLVAVDLTSKNLKSVTSFLVDPGSQANLIKENAIESNISINKSQILRLQGISKDPVYTKGSVEIDILGRNTEFHVVSQNFPIPHEGLLGAPFFRKQAVHIDFDKKHLICRNIYVAFNDYETIPIFPRTSVPFKIRITNPEIQTGYIPRQTVMDGIYLGDAAVTNDKGYAHLRVFNTTDQEFDLVVPSLPLEEFTTETSQVSSLGQDHTINVSLGQTTPYFEGNDHSNFDKNSPSGRESDPEISFEGINGSTGAIGVAKPPPEKNNSGAIGVAKLRCKQEKAGQECISNCHNIQASSLGQDSTPRVSLGQTPLEEAGKGNASNYSQQVGQETRPNCFKIQSSPGQVASCIRATEVTRLLRLDHLNPIELKSITNLIEEAADVFHLPNEKLGATTYAEHTIHTTDDVPVHAKQYRLPPVHKEEVNKQVQTLLKDGIIKQSNSPYNSPVCIVPKKADSHGNKRWRMVIDYRNLNEKTIGDAYPLPNITEILDQLGGAKYFSIFDLASGFHQIPMSEKDAPKTAFSTPFGHYQFNRMPFGLKNAPATFQRLMDNVLTGLQGQELFVYLDDIVIYASSLQEHEIKFRKLVRVLRQANLRLQPDKCEFLRPEVNYLGHIIGEDGVKPDPKKIDAVKNFPIPKNPKNIKQFLGLAGYYRRFIPNFSKTAKPLTELLKKDKVFKWEQTQTKAFEILKEALCTEPILQYPDFSKPFNLTTDASGQAIGGVLSQGPIGKDLPIAYASRLLNTAEQRYSTIEKECLAIVYCTSHFRPYLYGRKFTIVTDHKPLVWLHSVKDPSSRLWKWRHKLSEYEYRIEYKAGTANLNADALSRNPPGNVITALPIEAKRPRIIFETPSQEDSTSEITPPTKKSKPAEDSAMLRKLAEDLELSGITFEEDDANPFDPDTLTLEEQPEPTQENPFIPEQDTEYESDIRETEPGIATDHDMEPETPELEPPSYPCEPPATLEETPDNMDYMSAEEYESSDNESSGNETLQESDNEEIFDITNLPYSLPTASTPKPNVTEVRDCITMRKDNVVIFIDMEGKPCDNGARALKNNNALPTTQDLTFARGRVTPLGTKHLISLPIKFRESDRSTPENFEDAIRSLLDIVTELGLASVSIAKTPRIDDIPWSQIQNIITRILHDQNISITICKGVVSTPDNSLRLAIIQENHSSATGGHKGMTKTYQRIRQNYFWDNMKRDIQEYINQCRNCQIKKLTRIKTKQPMVITDTPGSAFDKVALDIVGPLPQTPQGNEYIVTMQDLLTKYSVGVPIKVANATTIADAFMKQFICRFGAPKMILTDQGSPFMTSLFKIIARRFNIKQYRTTAYHPQSNGSLERSHHVLAEYLKQYVENDRSWDTFIELAMFSYNTSVHEGTKFSPHELVFGRIARTPSSFPPIEENAEETYKEYLENLFDRLRELQETARTNLIAAKQRSKGYYDRKINPQNFQIGDQVYLLREPQKGKLADQYSGPHLVLDILPNNNAKISHKGKTRVVHFNKLKICKNRPKTNL